MYPFPKDPTILYLNPQSPHCQLGDGRPRCGAGTTLHSLHEDDMSSVHPRHIEAKTGPFGTVILPGSSWKDAEVMDNELE
jgi:hypothetical protein